MPCGEVANANVVMAARADRWCTCDVSRLPGWRRGQLCLKWRRPRRSARHARMPVADKRPPGG